MAYHHYTITITVALPKRYTIGNWPLEVEVNGVNLHPDQVIMLTVQEEVHANEKPAPKAEARKAAKAAKAITWTRVNVTARLLTTQTPTGSHKRKLTVLRDLLRRLGRSAIFAFSLAWRSLSGSSSSCCWRRSD